MRSGGFPLATVLIADDDGHIREVVRDALDKAGYGGIEASDGDEADWPRALAAAFGYDL